MDLKKQKELNEDLQKKINEYIDKNKKLEKEPEKIQK